MSLAIDMASITGKDSKMAPKPGCWKRMTAPIMNVMSSGACSVCFAGRLCEGTIEPSDSSRIQYISSRALIQNPCRHLGRDARAVLCARHLVRRLSRAGHHLGHWRHLLLAIEGQHSRVHRGELCHDALFVHVPRALYPRRRVALWRRRTGSVFARALLRVFARRNQAVQV